MFRRISQNDIGDIKTPKEAYNYAEDMGVPVPELESLIAQDPYYSYCYARRIIRDRFRRGENIIAQDPYWSYVYALNVIKGRFEEGEDAIAQSTYWNFRYGEDVLKNMQKNSI